MSALPRETEVKFAVRDRGALEERLRTLGASAGSEESEVNDLFDQAAGSLVSRGTVLRLRVVGRTGILTFKGKASLVGGVKSRLELETRVDAPERMRQILEELGYRPVFRYEKRRTTWRFSDPERPLVVVDETPLGLFAELEGEEDAIRRLAGELGESPDRFLTHSYPALWQLARQANPDLPESMVFPASVRPDGAGDAASGAGSAPASP